MVNPVVVSELGIIKDLMEGCGFGPGIEGFPLRRGGVGSRWPSG